MMSRALYQSSGHIVRQTFIVLQSPAQQCSIPQKQISNDCLCLYTSICKLSKQCTTSTHPLRAMSMSFLIPECSKMSTCDASGSNVTLNVKDFVVVPVSTWGENKMKCYIQDNIDDILQDAIYLFFFLFFCFLVPKEDPKHII